MHKSSGKPEADLGHRGIPALFGGSRGHRRSSRRGWNPTSHNTGNILGSACDGSDGRDRRGIRHGDLDQEMMDRPTLEFLGH
jgi:hypothetical protein